ncbi:MAG: COP23 domain-containing protein [Cyanobacteria bacterium J06643_5]
MFNFKLRKILGITSLSIAFAALISHKPSYANTRDFRCAVLNGVPITFARNQQREEIPIIYWVTNDLPVPWTAMRRCVAVSQRFQKNLDNGTLRIIKAGKVKGQSVVCGALKQEDPCTGNTLLFTLHPNRDANQVLLTLLDSSRSSQSLIVRQNSRRNSSDNPPVASTTGDSNNQQPSQSETVYRRRRGRSRIRRSVLKSPNFVKPANGIYMQQGRVYVDFNTYINREKPKMDVK